MQEVYDVVFTLRVIEFSFHLGQFYFIGLLWSIFIKNDRRLKAEWATEPLLVYSNSFLFPKTASRLESLRQLKRGVHFIIWVLNLSFLGSSVLFDNGEQTYILLLSQAILQNKALNLCSKQEWLFIQFTNSYFRFFHSGKDFVGS